MALEHTGWKSWRDMNALDKYMMFLAFFGKCFLVLQIIKIITDNSSESVSFSAYLLYFITNLSWFVFGVFYKDVIVTTSALLGVFGGLIAMNIVVAYKEKKYIIF